MGSVGAHRIHVEPARPVPLMLDEVRKAQRNRHEQQVEKEELLFTLQEAGRSHTVPGRMRWYAHHLYWRQALATAGIYSIVLLVWVYLVR